MTHREFVVKDIVKASFSKTLDNLGFFSALMFVSVLLSVGVHVLLSWLNVNSVIDLFLGQIVSLFFDYLIFCGAIQIVKGKTPKFSEITVDWKQFLVFCAVMAFASVAVVIGLLLFLIPGTIWGVWWMFAPIYALHSKSFVQSFVESRELARGRFWEIFWLMNALIMISFSGFLLLGVGALFTMPMAMVGLVMSYQKLVKAGA